MPLERQISLSLMNFIVAARRVARMELAETVSAGILPAPFYICGLYEYRDELRKISRRVSRQRNVGVRDESTKLLEKLRRCLQQADTPAEIFGRYMKKERQRSFMREKTILLFL